MAPSGRSLALVGSAILLLGGCGQAASPPASVSLSPAAPSTAPASATGSGSAVVDLRDAGSVRLQPGRYTSESFEPGIIFELDEGWSIGTLGNGFFDVQQQQATPDVIAVQFGNVTGVVQGAPAPIEPRTADAVARAIAENPALTVLGESESRLGGRTGYTVEVENAGSAHASILDVPAGRLGIDPGRRLWISVFDTPAGVVAVMVGGSVDDWDHALAVAEPVLESVVIGD
jgi:hypothetical protein